MVLVAVLTVLSLIFERTVSVSLLVVTLSLSAWTMKRERALAVSFLLGLLDSFIWVRALGISSVVFILMSLAIVLYRQRMDTMSGLVLFASGVVLELIYRLVFGLQLHPVTLMISGILLWGVWFIGERMGYGEGIYLKK